MRNAWRVFYSAGAALPLLLLLLAERACSHAYAPIVHDALTTNETLAAGRNAFLIAHLFEEFDAEVEKERDRMLVKAGGRGPNMHYDGGRDQKLGGKEEITESGKMVANTEEIAATDAVGGGIHQTEKESTVGTTTTRATTTTVAKMEEAGTEANEAGGGPSEEAINTIVPTPIRPVSREEEKDETAHPSHASLETAAHFPPKIENEELSVTEVPELTTTSAHFDEGSTTDKEAVNNNNNGSSEGGAEGAEPETENELFGGHPAWLRTVFLTVVCTGIGFFLLMLLIGLVGRCFDGVEGPNPSNAVAPNEQPVAVVERQRGHREVSNRHDAGSRAVPIVLGNPENVHPAPY